MVGFVLLAGCGRYRDFTLPVQPGNGASLRVEWAPRPEPVLTRGPQGSWDSHDVLNPSVIKRGNYLMFYSGYDSRTWRTGLATSTMGLFGKSTIKSWRPMPRPGRAATSLRMDRLYFSAESGITTIKLAALPGSACCAPVQNKANPWSISGRMAVGMKRASPTRMS